MLDNVTGATLDFIILLLRFAVVFFLYFFLYQVVRVLRRELQVAGTGNSVSAGSVPEAQQLGRLVVISPGATNLPQGHVFDLGLVNIMGRRHDIDVPLNDTFLSSEHALLEWRGDNWWLEDQHSTNGTFVNDIEVRNATPVTYGDVIRVGRVELKLSR